MTLNSAFVILVLIVGHYIGDFPLQSDEMALNKSKSLYWLFLHAYTYALFTLFFVAPLLGYLAGTSASWLPILWALLNGLLHFITDGITSRWTSKLWFMEHVPQSGGAWRVKEPSTRHNFFCMIGFDQLIHMATLTITTALLLR